MQLRILVCCFAALTGLLSADPPSGGGPFSPSGGDLCSSCNAICQRINLSPDQAGCLADSCVLNEQYCPTAAELADGVAYMYQDCNMLCQQACGNN